MSFLDFYKTFKTLMIEKHVRVLQDYYTSSVISKKEKKM